MPPCSDERCIVEAGLPPLLEVRIESGWLRDQADGVKKNALDKLYVYSPMRRT